MDTKNIKYPIIGTGYKTLSKIKDGYDAVVLNLTNDSHSIASDDEGNGNYLGCETVANLYHGTNIVVSNVEFKTFGSEGVEYNWVPELRKCVVTKLNQDSGYVDIEAIYRGKSFFSRFSLSKNKNGKDGYTVNLSNNSHIFIASNDGTIDQESTIRTDIEAFKGNVLADVEILEGEIKPKPGLRTRVSGSSVYITALVGVELAPAGYLDIPFMLDGKKNTKTFNWTKLRAPKDGMDGAGYLVTLSKDSYVANTNVAPPNREIAYVEGDLGGAIAKSPRATYISVVNNANHGTGITADRILHRGDTNLYPIENARIMLHNNSDFANNNTNTNYGAVYLSNDGYPYGYHPVTIIHTTNNYVPYNSGSSGNIIGIVLGKIDEYRWRYLDSSGSVYDAYVSDGSTYASTEFIKDLVQMDKFSEFIFYDSSCKKVSTTSIEFYGYGGKISLSPTDVGLSSFNVNIGYVIRGWAQDYIYNGPVPTANYTVKNVTFICPQEENEIGARIQPVIEGNLVPSATFSSDYPIISNDIKWVCEGEEIGDTHVGFWIPDQENNPNWEFYETGYIYPSMIEKIIGKTVTSIDSFNYTNSNNSSLYGYSKILHFPGATRNYTIPEFDRPFEKNFSGTTTHNTLNLNCSFQNLKEDEYTIQVTCDNRTFDYSAEITSSNNTMVMSIKNLLAKRSYPTKVVMTRKSDGRTFSSTKTYTTKELPPIVNTFAAKDADRLGGYTLMYNLSSPSPITQFEITVNGAKLSDAYDLSKELETNHEIKIPNTSTRYKLKYGDNIFIVTMKTDQSIIITETIVVYHAENFPSAISDLLISNINYKNFTVSYRVTDPEGDSYKHFISVNDSPMTEIFPTKNEYGKYVYIHSGAPAGPIPVKLKTVDSYNGAEYITDEIIIEVPQTTPPSVSGLSAFNLSVDGSCDISYFAIDPTIEDIDQLTHYVNVNGAALTEIKPTLKDDKFYYRVSGLPLLSEVTLGVAVSNPKALSKTVTTTIEFPTTPPPEFNSIEVSEEKKSGTYKIKYSIKKTVASNEIKYHFINIDNTGFKMFEPIKVDEYTFEYNGRGLMSGVHNAQLSVDTADGKTYSEPFAITIPQNFAPEIQTLQCSKAYSTGSFIINYSIDNQDDDRHTHYISIDDGEYIEVTPENPSLNNFIYRGEGLSVGSHKVSVKINDGMYEDISSIIVIIPIRDILGRFSEARSYISVFKSNNRLAPVDRLPKSGEFYFEIVQENCIECVAIKDTPNSFYVDSVEENNGIVCVRVNCENNVSVEKYFSLSLVDDGQTGPIGPPGNDAQVPDWVKEWDGEFTEVYGHAMYSPRIFAGEGGQFPTGIGLGRNALGESNDSSTTGLGVYNKGKIIGEIKSAPDDDGVMIQFGTGSSKMTVDVNGNVSTPKMTADEIVSTVNGGTTTINGGMITTNTLSADTLNGGTINANEINLINLNASNITAGKIGAEFIDVGEIAASKIISNGNYGTVKIDNGCISLWETHGGNTGATHNIYPGDWPVRVGVSSVIDSEYTGSTSVRNFGFRADYLPSKLTGAAHSFYLNTLGPENVTNVQVYVQGLSGLDIQWISGISTSCTISEVVANPVSVSGDYVNVRLRNTCSTVTTGEQNAVIFVTILGVYFYS